MVPRISSRHSSKRTRSWSAAKEGFTVSHSNQERTNNNVDSEARHRLLPWTEQGDREWFPSFSRKRAQMRRTVEYCRANSADSASAIGCCAGKGSPGPLFENARKLSHAWLKGSIDRYLQ